MESSTDQEVQPSPPYSPAGRSCVGETERNIYTTGEKMSSSCRKYRRHESHPSGMEEKARFGGYLAQSTRQVSATEISADAGTYTRMPPINQPGNGVWVAPLQQYPSDASLSTVGEDRYIQSASSRSKKYLSRRG